MTDPAQQGPGEQPSTGAGYGQQPYQGAPGQPGQPGQQYPGQPGQPGQPYAAAPLSPADDRQWASFSHLGGIIGILPSLILWLVFKDRGALTNQEGKEALNFQITVAIVAIAYSILNGILTFATLGFWAYIGWIPFIAIWVIDIVWSIMGFARVNAGGTWRYPVNFRFIK